MSKKTKYTDSKTETLKIESASNYCLSCNKLLTEEDHHPSILKEEESKETGYERKDYCSNCWKKIQDKNYYLFWIKKRIKIKKDKTISKKERNQIILSYFNYLQSKDKEIILKDEAIPQEQDIESVNQTIDYKYHLYFISHLLMKYGVFKWKKDIKDEEGSINIIFENRYTDEEVIIKDAQPSVETITMIKQDLQTFLKENQIDIEII